MIGVLSQFRERLVERGDALPFVRQLHGGGERKGGAGRSFLGVAIDPQQRSEAGPVTVPANHPPRARLELSG
jgi:hypothetical protein